MMPDNGNCQGMITITGVQGGVLAGLLLFLRLEGADIESIYIFSEEMN
jgi:hypothetical protein